ncbi:MAG: NAD-dependent protein deacetylase [Gammaproteobacteria bacterium]
MPNTGDVSPQRRLRQFVAEHKKLLVLTGAGVSTRSGIPDYRDEKGDWKRSAPMQFNDFVGNAASRQRYWARSMIGWPRVKLADPNDAHRALSALERSGHIQMLVTQNVDRLHQRAGSRHVIDLHGRLDQVECLDNKHVQSRDSYQAQLMAANPSWQSMEATTAPDGDADLDDVDFGSFVVAPCVTCGNVVKPKVVFYGESIPREVTLAANAALDDADALLVIGSSLMVFSGFRFARTMSQTGRPVAMLNRGVTRADDLLDLKIEADIARTLASLNHEMREPL